MKLRPVTASPSQRRLQRSSGFTLAEVLAALQAKRLIGGKLKALRLESKDAAGYVSRLIAKIGDTTLSIGANEFRQALGVTELRSVRLIAVRLRRRSVEFQGSGSGHGVGLCQWGARRQAEQGRSYEQILSYYFPESTLSVVDE